MVQKYGHEKSYEEPANRRMQVVYTHRMQERQVFMEELKEIRKRKEKRIIKKVIDSIGPKWYQALSELQRSALDSLEFSIYQDILNGLPVRTAAVMKNLGLYPRPNNIDLMNCVYLGRSDPKEMLAQLFLMTYGHQIDGKRSSYCLNSRLMLSGILYLGLNNLIELLRERFRPEKVVKLKSPKPQPRVPSPPASPYLQKMIAVLYEPPKRKHRPPPPLPNLDELNDYPYEEETIIPKPPPPPPVPPPPKKRLPRSYCDKLANVMTIEPHSSITALTMKKIIHTSHRKIRGSKMCLTEIKKTYGMGTVNRKKAMRRKKPVAPSTGLWNSQYLISGVFTVNGKTVYVLGSVSLLPPMGDLIHGGYKYMDGECINIHCGFRAQPPQSKPDPCDCVKKWHESVFQYIRKTKCVCGHYYDYGKEGSFPPDELPFFEKPTKHAPYQFNYHTIFDLDEKRLHVEKEFKRFWDTDSMMVVDDGTIKDKKDKKKKKKRFSTTCLGKKPKPEDYLKCALRLMRRVNVAARLPDLHLVPELKEWMRRRIYGPYSRHEKANILTRSSTYWQTFLALGGRGFGHVSPPFDPMYAGLTNWVHKQDLNEKFRKYTEKYKLELFRSHANVTNMFWTTMFQAQFPDKKFREIYFSYLFANIGDLQLMHPYSSKECTERKLMIAKNRYNCPPAGIEPEE